MGSNRHTRNVIAGLERNRQIHLAKVRAEQQRPRPDTGLISHRDAEIRAANERVARLRQRLPGHRNRG